MDDLLTWLDLVLGDLDEGLRLPYSHDAEPQPRDMWK